MPIEITGAGIGSFDLVNASITTEASITATTSATGNTCISTGAFGVLNPGNYWVMVFTPYITKGTTNIDVELFQGATAAAGTFLQTLTGHMTASVGLGTGMTFLARQTLAAGSNQLTVTAFVDAGTGKWGAGAGTTGAAPPSWIRVFTA